METACFSPDTQALPDFADFLLDHRLAGFASEGGCELRHVGYDAIDARFAGRMRVGDSGDAQVLGPLVLTGPLRVSDKETLVGGEAVLRQQVLPACLFLPRDVGEKRSAEVGYVLAAGQLGVDVDVVDDDVPRVLLALAVDAILEGFCVLGCPPVLEVALSVELAAFVIEAVR